MKVEIIGSGGAFDEISSSYLVDDSYLIDCGESAVNQLIERDLIGKITDIFITHIHQDHVGGLEKFLYYRLITRGYWEIDLDLTIHCGKDVMGYYKTLAVSKNPRKIQKVGRFHETEGEYYQPFKFHEISKNDNSSIRKKTVHVNSIDVIHMYGAIPCFAFVFVNNENADRAFFTGDTDKLPWYIDKNQLDNGMTAFIDMGWTGVPEQDVQFHPSEQDIFDELGYHENIIGTHTSAELKYYKQAKPKDVFYI